MTPPPDDQRQPDRARGPRPRAPRRPARLRLASWGLACAAAASGCSSSDQGAELRSAIAQGEFGRAAASLEERMTTNRGDRDYMLDRMRLLWLRLADGQTQRTEPVAADVFDLLRTQGINDDKTVAAAVLGEGGVIFWKGEPFEQAMAFAAISVHKGVAGEWDNARAAAQSSLFLLKDFGDNERGGRKTTGDIAAEAARRERQTNQRPSDGDAFDQYLEKGYTPAKTDFALGYFLAGVANLALAIEGGDPAREDEARDNFREAFTLRPSLRPVADALVERRANTVFIVDFGVGPEKEAYGPDGALARFSPIVSSDERPMRLRQDGYEVGAFPPAADSNRMALDHMWNNLEDVREAKSSLGTLLLTGGALTAVSSDNSTAQIVGASLAGLGLLFKATSRADLRACEALPQRTYIAAVRIDRPDTAVRFSIDSSGSADGAGGLTLPAIDPPAPPAAIAMHYVRLPGAQSRRPWQWPGEVVYANDAYAGPVPGDDLPYILGGRCVHTPTAQTLARYQAEGNLLDYSLDDLLNLYRDEGITFDSRGIRGREALHVLEGGRSMAAPEPGSSAYARIFCQTHPPYRPRSASVPRALEANSPGVRAGTPSNQPIRELAPPGPRARASSPSLSGAPR